MRKSPRGVGRSQGEEDKGVGWEPMCLPRTLRSRCQDRMKPARTVLGNLPVWEEEGARESWQSQQAMLQV